VAAARADILHAANYPRLEPGTSAGLRSGFAFPVSMDGTLLGVMEFYTHEPDLLDDDLLSAMTTVGLQIGQFLARKRTEHQLRLTQESYRLLAETAPDAILTIEQEGNIVFANAAAGAVFGYSADEFVRMNVAALMPPYMRDRHRAALKRYVATRDKSMQWRGLHLPGLRKDGTEVALELSFAEFFATGQQLFTAFIRDVSEQRRLEQRLETSREHLLIALQAGRMGTWEWEVATGRVAWSPGLEELHGRVPGSFPDRVEAVLAEILPEDRERVQQTIAQAVQTGSAYRTQYRIRTPEGEIRVLDARGKVFFGNDGKPERMLGVCADVTER
jgi:PAS domain S-box-containing protein